MNLDRNLVTGLAIIVVLWLIRANLWRLPDAIVYMLGFFLGGWLISIGWQAWRGTPGGGARSGQRVQYWRGQRIVIDEPPQRTLSRSLSWSHFAAGIYMLLGTLLLLMLVLAVLENFL